MKLMNVLGRYLFVSWSGWGFKAPNVFLLGVGDHYL